MPGFILPAPAANGKTRRDGATGQNREKKRYGENKTGIGENTVEISE